MEPFEENRFLVALNQKEEWAFNALFKEFYPRLCLYAKKYLRQDQEIEDIVSESFASFWKTAQCDDISHARAYLYTIVRNKCFKLKVSNKRREAAVIAFGSIDENVSDRKDAFNTMVSAEIHGRLMRDLNELPSGCATVCRMIFFEGMETSEVARILGLAITTVKTQKSRGIKYLENKYKGKSPLYLPMMIAI